MGEGKGGQVWLLKNRFEEIIERQKIQRLEESLVAEGLKEVQSLLERRIQEIVRERRDEGDALWALEELYILDKVASFVGHIFPSSTHGNFLFVMDSLLLADCVKELKYDGKEKMLLLSGILLEERGIVLVNRIHRPQLESSPAHVRHKPGELISIARQIEPYGPKIAAILHSHPGRGIPSPSSDDREFQRAMEELGYRSIAGIVTNEGYIRFFSENLAFDLLVLGRRAKKVRGHDYVYQVEL